MHSAIHVENLSKAYSLQRRQLLDYQTLRETLARLLRRGRGPQRAEKFWALKEVCFRINPGELVALVGRNGAGKSTLLKVLARITAPSEGRALVRGRVGSLLEAGAGFHLELTGRENIFLNGAILGMKRREINRKFDAIVELAEAARFLDVPVKRYSTGMYLRLAFAVAANLEPDVVLVDEVLALGDADFQRKYLEQLETVAANGRTVVMVSHDLAMVTRWCKRALWLEAGQLVADGPSSSVVEAYLRSGHGLCAQREWPELDAAPGNHLVRLRAARAAAENGLPASAVDIRAPLLLETEFDVLEAGHVLVPSFHVQTGQGVQAFVVHGLDDWQRRPRPVGRYRCRVRVPGNFLAEGTLLVSLGVATPRPFRAHCFARDALSFQVVDDGGANTSRGDFTGKMPGVLRPSLECQTELVTEERACA
ncbi:MAG: ABC transporter ATP-binding protein [Gemmataceae bacterium]